MQLLKCSRCGGFYSNSGYVCPKCTPKDNSELITFKNFVNNNAIEVNSLNQISSATGITEKNLNRFLDYQGLEVYKKLFI